MTKDYETNGNKVITNYKGQIYVSVEVNGGNYTTSNGAIMEANKIAKERHNELKAQYDAENAVNCAECARINNIVAPEPKKAIEVKGTGNLMDAN